MKKIALIQPMYPYGKPQIYLGSSLFVVAAQLKSVGCATRIFDLNLESVSMDSFAEFDCIGITVIGVPYIPGVIALAEELSVLGIPIVIGGQSIAKLGPAFSNIVSGNIILANNESAILSAIGCKDLSMPSPFEVSLKDVYESLDRNTLLKYLSNEGALFISQGCHFKCAFCAAAKAQPERFRNIQLFREDLLYLALQAKENQIPKLSFYATNLDFFQSPRELIGFLDSIIEVHELSGVTIEVRCLACMSSFIQAEKRYPGIHAKSKKAGLRCIGFGVDGTDASVWKSQKKTQNTLSDIPKCLAMAKEHGFSTEILLVMGFPKENFRILAKMFLMSCGYILRYPHTVLRPYLAKEHVHGNDNWDQFQKLDQFLKNPDLFFNLDFCMIGSKITHPYFWHRFWSNMTYLAICGLFSPFGKCRTSPLMPFGDNRIWNGFARWWNRTVPFDR